MHKKRKKKVGVACEDIGFCPNQAKTNTTNGIPKKRKERIFSELSDHLGLIDIEYDDLTTIKKKLKNGELDYIALTSDETNPTKPRQLGSKKNGSTRKTANEKNSEFIYNENLCLDAQIDCFGKKFGVYSIRKKHKVCKAIEIVVAYIWNGIRNILFGVSLSQVLIFLTVLGSFLALSNIEFFDKFGFWFDLSAAVIGLFSSKFFSDLIKYYPLTGYWRYYTQNNSKEPVAANYKERTKDKYARVMRLYRCDGQLKMCAYVQSLPNRPHCHSRVCEVMYTSPSRKEGVLTYWFDSQSVITSDTKKNVRGMAMLEWHIEKNHLRVMEMSGDFCGIITKRTGVYECERISRKEFKRYIKGN